MQEQLLNKNDIIRQAQNQKSFGQNSSRQSQNEGQGSGLSQRNSHSPGYQGLGVQQKKDKTRTSKSRENSRDISSNQSGYSNKQNVSGLSNQDMFTYQQNMNNQNKMRQSKKYQQNTFQQAAGQKNNDKKSPNRSGNISQNQLSFEKHSSKNQGSNRSTSNNHNRHNEIVMVEKDNFKKQGKNSKSNSHQGITMENKIKRTNEKNIEFCQNCNQKFGMFLGRFLCNTCKSVFCKKCTIQNDDKKQRSCQSCREDQKEFEGLQQQQEHERNVIDIAQQNKQKKRQISQKRKDEEGQDLSRNLHRLIDFKINNGIEKTREMIAKESQEIGVIGRIEQSELMMSQNQSRRITQKQLFKGLNKSSIKAKVANFTNPENKNIMSISQDMFLEELENLDENMEEYLNDIQQRVMKEFEIDQDCWSQILKKFIRQAIDTVKPCSSMIPKDSIDINQHIKIMAIQYQDTSKCQYVNGVVIKKSLANKHMKSQIENPKIIVLAKSLGYLKEDQDFFDVQQEQKSETENNQIILQKIESVKPQIIFVRKDANHLIIEKLHEKGITVVSNVKETAIERITKLTQTLSLPNINLLSKNFGCGRCEHFYVEQIQQGHALNYDQKFIQSNQDLIFLEGCSPSRGCTILLSGPDLAELKIVKHALKKMLRLSRIIFLEKEYYDNLNLILSPFAPEDKDGEKTMFLYKKHIERDFLIFKEMTFSKRGVRNNEEPEEQTSYIDKIQQDAGNQEVNQQKIINTERDVYAYVQQICKPATMKKVHFYNEDEKFRDIGLGKKLKELLADSCKKCKRQQDQENQTENDNDCQAYEYQHVRQFYHNQGYVECRTRFKEQDKPIDQQKDLIKQLMKKKDLPIYIFCHCIPCKKDVISNEEMSRQVQEFSFYCFLEQFFYGQDTRSFQYNPDQEDNINYGFICQDKFHQNSKITFKIGPLSVEFTYYPVQIYSLDLISFKDLPGKITPKENVDKFEKSKNQLTQNVQECFNFIIESCRELNHWLQLLYDNVFNIQSFAQNVIIKNSDYSLHKSIVEAIITYIGLIQTNCQEYQSRVQQLLNQYKYHHEFYLNKVQNLITRRLLDYVFLLKIIYEQTFSEFILNCAPKPKGKQEKINKKEQVYQLNQEIKNRLSSTQNQQNKFQDKGLNQMVKQTSNSNNLFRDDLNKKSISSEITKANQFGSSNFGDSDLQLKRASEAQSFQKAQVNDDQSLFMDDGDDLKKVPSQLENQDPNQSPKDHDFDKLQLKDEVDNLMTFEERLKNNVAFKEIMLMSPSIPMGFDSNCTKINLNDLSTIICQSLLSNEHLHGLKQQGFMGLDQRLVKTQQVWKNTSIYQGLPDKMLGANQGKDQSQTIDTQVIPRSESTQIIEFDQIQTTTSNQPGQINQQLNKNQSKNTPVMEEFSVFKENQDVLNKQISNKEIETELLRIEQFKFQINFYNFKDPKQAELKMLKGLADQVAQTIKVDRPIISSNKVLEEIELLQPADIDINFYRDINNIIIKLIHDFKNTRETLKNLNQVENKIKNYQQSDKYEIYGLWHTKAEISVIIYFPSHFQALRKLYCGSFSTQCEQLYKSSYWGDNTGGKSKSDFYKSSDDKYVMKKISSSEMHMFNAFGLSYFEYMCRAFNQKCPTAIGKILGAFKVQIKPYKEKQQSYYIVMMENLTIGIDPQKQSLKKYDLKGSQRNRYIDIDSISSNVTRLDTNFLKDRKSLPFCLNYTMSRLLEIAIHNDTSFLSKNKKVDYSLIAWIDEEKKLIRLGIIDYIQDYNLVKQIETIFKKGFNTNVKDPTILNPKNYKERFKRAMNNYFVGMLQDKPCASLFELMNSEQVKDEPDQIKS